MQTIPLNVKGLPNCNINLEAISISDFYARALNGRGVGNGDLACYEEGKAYFTKR